MSSNRYVILRHEGIADPHFDLMFEISPGSLLATWRSAAWPIREPTSVTRLPDHRRIYLDYEGPLSHDRGHVRRLIGGTCQIIIEPTGRWRIEFDPPTAPAPMQLWLAPVAQGWLASPPEQSASFSA